MRAPEKFDSHIHGPLYYNIVRLHDESEWLPTHTGKQPLHKPYRLSQPTPNAHRLASQERFSANCYDVTPVGMRELHCGAVGNPRDVPFHLYPVT